MKARVTSVDVSSKTITLSALSHIVAMTEPKSSLQVGESFANVKVERLIYGKSFLVRVGKDQLAFLHKSNVKEVEE